MASFGEAGKLPAVTHLATNEEVNCKEGGLPNPRCVITNFDLYVYLDYECSPRHVQ